MANESAVPPTLTGGRLTREESHRRDLALRHLKKASPETAALAARQAA
jgi:hypothetical protein